MVDNTERYLFTVLTDPSNVDHNCEWITKTLLYGYDDKGIIVSECNYIHDYELPVEVKFGQNTKKKIVNLLNLVINVGPEKIAGLVKYINFHFLLKNSPPLEMEKKKRILRFGLKKILSV